MFFKKDYRKTRKDCIAKGRKIVCENVDDFMDWFRTRDIGPLIGQMKEKFGQISRKELERFFARVRQEAAHRELTESMVNRIVNKLLYCVISSCCGNSPGAPGFPRKREFSFFALDPCFRRGDIVDFCFPQQILIKNINVVAKKYGQAEAAKLVDSIVQQVEVMLSEPDDKEKVHL